MRCSILITVAIIAMAAAGPVPPDLLFASGLEGPGDSTYSESLFDPLYGESMVDSNDLFSSSAPSNSNDLLFAEMLPGNMPTTDQENSLNEPFLFDPGNIPAENDLFGQFSQGQADGDCTSDVMQGFGKLRLGRSCSDLKETKRPKHQLCVKDRSQICCCSSQGLVGVYNTGCEACMHSSLFCVVVLWLWDLGWSFRTYSFPAHLSLTSFPCSLFYVVILTFFLFAMD